MIVYLSLILFSGFFSSAETSLLSVNQVRLKHRASLNERKAINLLSLLKKPESVIATLLVGNNLVNVAVASLTTVVSSRFLKGDEQWTVLVSTVITTVVLLTFGEIIPKSFGYRHRDRLAFFYVSPVRFFYYVLFPVVAVFSSLSKLFMGKSGHGGEKRLSLTELKHILASEVEMFSNEPDTLRMVNEIIDLAERDVKAVMTTRIDIIAVSEQEGLDGVRRILSEKKVFNIPVFRENTEQIIGVIAAKNLVFPLLNGKGNSLSLNDIMDPPLFVSEFSTLRYVLAQFKRHKTHFAVVIDEYGDTMGVVTQSDIFQNVLGNLDFISSPVQRIGRRVYRVMASLAIDEARSLLPVDIEERKDYSTLAGFFIYHLGKMPKEGARLRYAGAVWIVEKMVGLRIEHLKVILETGE